MINIPQGLWNAISSVIKRAYEEIMKNVYDPDTEVTEKRKLQINVEVIPSKERDTQIVNISSKTKLAQPVGEMVTILSRKDMLTGQIQLREYSEAMDGQTRINESIVVP